MKDTNRDYLEKRLQNIIHAAVTENTNTSCYLFLFRHGERTTLKHNGCLVPGTGIQTRGTPRANVSEGLGHRLWQINLQYWSTWLDAAQVNKPSQHNKRTEILQEIMWDTLLKISAHGFNLQRQWPEPIIKGNRAINLLTFQKHINDKKTT